MSYTCFVDGNAERRVTLVVYVGVFQCQLRLILPPGHLHFVSHPKHSSSSLHTLSLSLARLATSFAANVSWETEKDILIAGFQRVPHFSAPLSLLGIAETANEKEEMERPPQLQRADNWDAAIDLTLRRFVYGSISGAATALFLFRNPTTRWASVAFGAGIGLGSAFTDSSQLFGSALAKWPSVSTSVSTPASVPTPASISHEVHEPQLLEEIQEVQS